jgi:hypothetical protein
MWVRKFGVQEQVEQWVKGQLLVSHLDVTGLTFLDNSTRVNWLDDCINSFTHVLNKDWFTLFNSHLNILWHFWVGQSGNFKTMWFPGLL